MKKITKQITAGFLAALFGVAAVTTPALAAEKNTPKEEVVYVNLNNDGSVKEINVVNIFDLKESSKIVDYGKYTNLNNMTTTDKIDYKNDTVTIDAGTGKLYYQGKLEGNEMPWDIAVKYYLDGKEYIAKEIVGKSGKLEIKMSIRQNKNCDSSFFRGYALQTTFILNTDNAENIVAEGGTVANVGKNKQLTYTVLPNKEKDITISADVKNFEMDAISINGVRLNLNIEVDDSSIQEKIDEAVTAVSDLDKGADKLSTGTEKLYAATGKFEAATEKLHTGTASLYNGANELNSGLNKLTAKNNELKVGAMAAYEALCKAAETQLNAKLTADGLNPVTLTTENYSEALGNIMEQLKAASTYNKAYEETIKEVAGLKGQLDNYGVFYNGLSDYTKAVSSAANGSEKITEGLSALYNNTAKLEKSAANLHIATGKLKTGINEMKDGTGEFVAKTEDIDSKVDDEIDSKISSLTGEDVKTVSFVSKDNVNIKSVQFVIKTENISMEKKAATVTEETVELSFWQKLVRLFGIK